mmetsp:Transcript_2852/g.6636  ORF Transcript_2852/g.6636 Transcript_2852/m.6636 type:complete len:309 (+) Transcript_2852:287-1213(+)
MRPSGMCCLPTALFPRRIGTRGPAVTLLAEARHSPAQALGCASPCLPEPPKRRRHRRPTTWRGKGMGSPPPAQRIRPRAPPCALSQLSRCSQREEQRPPLNPCAEGPCGRRLDRGPLRHSAHRRNPIVAREGYGHLLGRGQLDVCSGGEGEHRRLPGRREGAIPGREVCPSLASASLRKGVWGTLSIGSSGQCWRVRRGRHRSREEYARPTPERHRRRRCPHKGACQPGEATRLCPGVCLGMERVRATPLLVRGVAAAEGAVQEEGQVPAEELRGGVAAASAVVPSGRGLRTAPSASPRRLAVPAGGP